MLPYEYHISLGLFALRGWAFTYAPEEVVIRMASRIAGICSQMAAGVRAAAGSVVRAAENVASKVRSLLHFSVPDTGPLSDADEYMPDFMKLLASGIKKNQDKVVKAVKTLSGSMKTNLNTPVGDMGDKVKSVVSGFATTISGSTTRVRSAASGLASGIRTGLMSGLEGMPVFPGCQL